MSKILKVSLFACCVMFFCACAKNQQNPESANTNSAKSDGLPEGYVSGMLLVNDVKGPAVRVVVESYYCMDGEPEIVDADHLVSRFTYDYSDGKLTSVIDMEGQQFYDMSSLSIEYDSQNRITRCAFADVYERSVDSQFSYGNDGLIAKESKEENGETYYNGDYEYIYNADKDIESKKYVISAEGETFEGAINYSIKERDSKGNWTQRYVDDIFESEGEEVKSRSIECRKIYYKGDQLPE